MTHSTFNMPICDICGNTDPLTIYKFRGICYCDNDDCQVELAILSNESYRSGKDYETEFINNENMFEEDIKKLEAKIESRRKK